jgi:hypothetical protein
VRTQHTHTSAVALCGSVSAPAALLLLPHTPWCALLLFACVVWHTSKPRCVTFGSQQGAAAAALAPGALDAARRGEDWDGVEGRPQLERRATQLLLNVCAMRVTLPHAHPSLCHHPAHTTTPVALPPAHYHHHRLDHSPHLLVQPPQGLPPQNPGLGHLPQRQVCVCVWGGG